MSARVPDTCEPVLTAGKSPGWRNGCHVSGHRTQWSTARTSRGDGTCYRGGWSWRGRTYSRRGKTGRRCGAPAEDAVTENFKAIYTLYRDRTRYAITAEPAACPSPVDKLGVRKI